MLMKNSKVLCMAAAIAALTLAGCSGYVKKTDFNAAVQKLQAKDQDLQQQINSLSQDMQQKLAKYDARITAMEGRVKVDTVAHFDFNKANLHDSDKAMLDDFAKVMNAHHTDAVVTVEGFTDPAGSASYNKKLGQERADAVRNYLVGTAGMTASQVRAVSYGEDRNRQVEPGKTHQNGAENRHVSLVVDFAGNGS